MQKALLFLLLRYSAYRSSLDELYGEDDGHPPGGFWVFDQIDQQHRRDMLINVIYGICKNRTCCKNKLDIKRKTI